MMDLIRNAMQLEAERVLALPAKPRIGIVTNYDPDHYAARVLLQPEDFLTGYLPITTPWVGNGWGFYAPPSIGDKVEVHFQQDGKEAGFIVNRFYSTKTVPLFVPSGEFWVVHQSGSTIRFTNAGDVIITANRDLKLHAGRRFVFDANGQGQIWDGLGVETWQDNDVAKPHHNHAPPQIPS